MAVLNAFTAYEANWRVSMKGCVKKKSTVLIQTTGFKPMSP